MASVDSDNAKSRQPESTGEPGTRGADAVGNTQAEHAVGRTRVAAEQAYAYCMPAERNVHGPERVGRSIIGVAIGAFGIVGVIAAEQPILGSTLTILLLGITGYLLATAKTQKCPVKHVSSNATDRA